MKFCIIDLETTGLDPSVHGIVEIGALMLDCQEGCSLQEIGHFDELCNPLPCEFDPEAMGVNGLPDDPEFWEQHPSSQRMVETLMQWVSSHREDKEQIFWVGANPRFDRNFVEHCRGRDTTDVFHHRTLDVQSMAVPLWLSGKVQSISLRSLMSWAGITRKQRHRAIDDCVDTFAVLEAILSAA